jgi:hypothetical protein
MMVIVRPLRRNFGLRWIAPGRIFRIGRMSWINIAVLLVFVFD